ncbi:MAG TPA: isochorismatase family protein [Caulobacteraceae bacterium]|nr:isochorismatase family protein [Caulobacteraceae bacterium]
MSEMWTARGRAPRDRLLVCLDLQQVSLGPRGGVGPDRCIVNCRRVLAHARQAGWRIVHVHTRQALPAAARPIEGLEPLPSEPVLYRTGISAFSSPDFRRMVADGPCELVIVGCSMTASCFATALIAHDEDISVTLVDDAVSAAPMDEGMRYAMDAMSRQIAGPLVELTSTSALVGPVKLLRVV